MATTFELTEKQDKAVRTWMLDHAPVHKNDPIDCTGAYLRFTFMPTGLGVVKAVECIYCTHRLPLVPDEGYED